MNAFEAGLVRFVREMSDGEILELVRNQLNGVEAGPSARRATRVAVAAAAAPSRRRGRRTRGARISKGSPQHEALLSKVEKTIVGSKGLSVSQVAKATSLPKLRVASVIRELKGSKRIFQAGERRFARYGKTKQIAQKASSAARGG
jgi:hypothetical protein